MEVESMKIDEGEVLKEVLKADYEGRLIQTWQPFVVFWQDGHHVIMNEDKTKVYAVIHKPEDTADFLIRSRCIKYITTVNETLYEVVDQFDHYDIRIYDKYVDGDLLRAETEEEAMKLIEKREKDIYGKFEIVEEEEEVNIP
jgi:hypothetical protein